MTIASATAPRPQSRTSGEHLCRLRYARWEPTRALMVAITDACRRILAFRTYAQLFDPGGGE